MSLANVTVEDWDPENAELKGNIKRIFLLLCIVLFKLILKLLII